MDLVGTPNDFYGINSINHAFMKFYFNNTWYYYDTVAGNTIYTDAALTTLVK
jgi:transglutaminase/protease-like cytokinesis protein 3